MAKNITKKEKRINRFVSIVAWILIVGGVTGILVLYISSSSKVTTNDAQVAQYIIPVSSKISGFIEEIRFRENQYVHKGDTLVIIDNREFKNHVTMAQAGLQTTAGNITTIRSGVESKMSNVGAIRAQIEAAKTEVWRTEQDYNRCRTLLEQEAATAQQFEQAKAAYAQAQAKLRALQEEINAIEIQAKEQLTKIAPVKSQISGNSANLENAKIQLSYSVVTAPFDGWTGRRTIQPGELVKEGQALVQMVSKEKWIVANFKETQIGKIDMKKPVKIKADAFPDIEFEGTIESISPAAGSEFSLLKPDNATGNFVKVEQRFPVRILLKPNPENSRLLSGMNVIVEAAESEH